MGTGNPNSASQYIHIYIFRHSIDVLMCLLFLSLFHSAPAPASMYVYHHIWRNNKFYWNYFIDKLMFALCIQNAQTCWTTMTMTAQTECKRELKRHLRQPLLPNIRISEYRMGWIFHFHSHAHAHAQCDRAYLWHLLWKRVNVLSER